MEADEDAVEMTESVSREYTIYTIQRERVRNSVDKRLRHHGLQIQLLLPSALCGSDMKIRVH